MRITSPCNENYDNMPPSSDGRFCASCQTVVIDFTRMNNQEISDYLKKNSSTEVCGRFKSPQVGEGRKFEKFIWKLKERVSERVQFVPLRIAFVGILTGLSAFMSSCMGAVQRDYPMEEPKSGNTDKIEKVNQEQKTDSIKEIPKK